MGLCEVKATHPGGNFTPGLALVPADEEGSHRLVTMVSAEAGRLVVGAYFLDISNSRPRADLARLEAEAD